MLFRIALNTNGKYDWLSCPVLKVTQLQEVNTEPNIPYFRYSLVAISVLTVFKIPTSVSVSVFENIKYRFGIS